jgi:hypothetical protein
MRRIRLAVVLALSLALAPLAVEAQQTFLWSTSSDFFLTLLP